MRIEKAPLESLWSFAHIQGFAELTTAWERTGKKPNYFKKSSAIDLARMSRIADQMLQTSNLPDTLLRGIATFHKQVRETYTDMALLPYRTGNEVILDLRPDR